MKGRMVSLSRFRRMMVTLNDASNTTQKGVISREIAIPRLAALQADPARRKAWTVVFAKAYALAAKDRPELRRIFVSLPWAHLYEYPVSVAAISVAREVDGEECLLVARLKEPEARSLEDLDRAVRQVKTGPIADNQEFRLLLFIATLPRPVRRFLVWLGLNIGHKRGYFTSTVGVSSLAPAGADIEYGIHPGPVMLSFGPVGSNGVLRVYLSFDHRVFDGGVAVKALTSLESLLDGVIADEVASSIGSGPTPQ